MLKSVIEIIGAQIADKRKKRGFTQEHLGELVKVSTETISRLERGVSVPSLKTLEKVSRALKTPLKEFFENISEPKNVSPYELSKIMNLLKTRDKEDIEMSYRIIKDIFKNIDQNYCLKEK